MSVVRRTDGLLSGLQTISLLALLKSHGEGKPEDHLLRNLAALHSSSWSRAANSILFLRELDALVEQDGRLHLGGQIGTDFDAWRRQLAASLAQWLAARISLGTAGQCVQALE